jgi:plasmid maintenance system antidote protein VapI
MQFEVRSTGMGTKLKPIHPGEREESVEPLGLNPHKVSLALRVSAPTVSEIACDKGSVSPDMG